MQQNEITLALVERIKREKALAAELAQVRADIDSMCRTVDSLQQRHIESVRNAKEAQAALEKSRQNSE